MQSRPLISFLSVHDRLQIHLDHFFLAFLILFRWITSQPQGIFLALACGHSNSQCWQKRRIYESLGICWVLSYLSNLPPLLFSGLAILRRDDSSAKDAKKNRLSVLVHAFLHLTTDVSAATCSQFGNRQTTAFPTSKQTSSSLQLYHTFAPADPNVWAPNKQGLWTRKTALVQVLVARNTGRLRRLLRWIMTLFHRDSP